MSSLLLRCFLVVALAVPAFATSYLPVHVNAAGGELAVVWDREDGVLYVFSLHDGTLVRKVDLGGALSPTILYDDARGVFRGEVYDASTDALSAWQWNPKTNDLRTEPLPARTMSNLEDEATVAFTGEDLMPTLEPVPPERVDVPFTEWAIARGQTEWVACDAARLVCFASRSPEKAWERRNALLAGDKDARVERLFADPLDSRTVYAVVVSAVIELWRTRDGARTWTPVGKRWETGGVIPRPFFMRSGVWLEIAGTEDELRLVRIDRGTGRERELRLRVP